MNSDAELPPDSHPSSPPSDAVGDDGLRNPQPSDAPAELSDPPREFADAPDAPRDVADAPDAPRDVADAPEFSHAPPELSNEVELSNEAGLPEQTELSEEAQWRTARARLLERFESLIDQAAEDPRTRRHLIEQAATSGPLGFSAAGAPMEGLAEIVGSLTALRHEMKLQTKSGRALLERIQEDADRFVSAASYLVESFAKAPRDADDHRGRPLAEALADVDEALQRSRAALDAMTARWEDLPPPERTPPWYARRWVYGERAATENAWRQQAKQVQAIAEGLRLVAARVDAHLEENQIVRLGSVGDFVDPHTMQVLNVVSEADVPPGTVVEVHRPGYRYRSALLRPAQVTAAAGTL